jgi:hypothetical protein
MRRGWQEVVILLVQRMEKVLEKYPMPSLYIKLLHVVSDHHYLEQRPSEAMRILNNLLYHLNERGMKKLEFLNCYMKKCKLQMRTNKYLDSFSDIKEGVTIAEKSGFLNQVLEFKFMLVELLIQSKNFTEATEIMQGKPSLYLLSL